MKAKQDYRSRIKLYECRRNAIRASYDTWKNNLEYALRSKHLTNKIRIWKEQIRRIDKREKQLKLIGKQICEFLDIPIFGGNALPLRNSIHDERLILARDIFYKYGMEQGLKGSWLSRWTGTKRQQHASERRMAFTRSFKYSKENRRIYHQFINYVNINELVGSIGGEEKAVAA